MSTITINIVKTDRYKHQVWIFTWRENYDLPRRFLAYKNKTEKQAIYLSQFAKNKALKYYKKIGVKV